MCTFLNMISKSDQFNRFLFNENNINENNTNENNINYYSNNANRLQDD